MGSSTGPRRVPPDGGTAECLLAATPLPPQMRDEPATARRLREGGVIESIDARARAQSCDKHGVRSGGR